MTTQQTMSELLKSLGFGTMAKDVLKETDKQRLAKYATVIVKNSPSNVKLSLATKLNFLLNQ